MGKDEFANRVTIIGGSVKNPLTKREEWEYIDALISVYQKQFYGTGSTDDSEKGKAAIAILLDRFQPLFKKYLALLKSGQINFGDAQIRIFVKTFMTDKKNIYALKQDGCNKKFQSEIHESFDFIVKTYGALPEEEIIKDLYEIFLKMAKRYKKTDKSFCCYLHNVYLFYLSRHIKKYTGSVSNIQYKLTNFDETYVTTEESFCDTTAMSYEVDYDKSLSETLLGMPNQDWLEGGTCSDTFKDLSAIERQIVVKYYLENWNDAQIAAAYGVHFNTVNHKRRSAIIKIAKALGFEPDHIKRTRRSGKKAL